MEIVQVGPGILAALREPIGFGSANLLVQIGDPSPPPAVLALMGLA